jgi:hypothetical protein
LLVIHLTGTTTNPVLNKQFAYRKRKKKKYQNNSSKKTLYVFSNEILGWEGVGNRQLLYFFTA